MSLGDTWGSRGLGAGGVFLFPSKQSHPRPVTCDEVRTGGREGERSVQSPGKLRTPTSELGG